MCNPPPPHTLSLSLSLSLSHSQLFCSFCSTFTLNLFLSRVVGNEFGVLGAPSLVDFGVFQQVLYTCIHVYISLYMCMCKCTCIRTDAGPCMYIIYIVQVVGWPIYMFLHVK